MNINGKEITFSEFAELYMAYKEITRPMEIKTQIGMPAAPPAIVTPTPAPEVKPEEIPGQTELMEKMVKTMEGLSARIQAIENKPPAPMTQTIEPKGLDDIINKVLR